MNLKMGIEQTARLVMAESEAVAETLELFQGMEKKAIIAMIATAYMVGYSQCQKDYETTLQNQNI